MNERIWISVVSQDFDHEYYQRLTAEGFEEKEPDKKFSMKMLAKTSRRSEAVKLVRLALKVAEEMSLLVKTSAVVQPACLSCGLLNKFSAMACFKCKGPITAKRDILQELVIKQPVEQVAQQEVVAFVQVAQQEI